MSKLPLLKTRQVVKILHKLGFRKVRQRGSHMFFSHPDGRTTVVPNHPTKQIGRGLLHEILHEIELSPESFEKLR